MLNKQKGNMYPFVTHTWNPIRGKCPHACRYCYVPKSLRGSPWGPLRLTEKYLKDNLGSERFIFVGSSTDMWANDIPAIWINQVLTHVSKFEKNTYLFQSKNPRGFKGYGIPRMTNCIEATTIETNREYNVSHAPQVRYRMLEMRDIFARKMVSIEPIMDFDLPIMLDWIKQIQPEFVSIGADSGKNSLPEPSSDKIKALIARLEKITQVIQKDNLKRLLVSSVRGETRG